MSKAEDWKQYKLRMLSRLRGMTFRLATYKAPSSEWEHDHCEGCGSTFAEFDGPEILHSGYSVIYEIVKELPEVPVFVKQMREQGREVLEKPDSTLWVCKECFKEFRQVLELKVAKEN